MSQQCPYHDDNHHIPKVPEPDSNPRDEIPPSSVGYCHSCKGTVLRCHKCLSWNRAFARFCTQCGNPLEKPHPWAMSGAGPQRVGLSRFRKGIDRLQPEYGFKYWSIQRPPAPRENVPSLLAFDGLLLVPNFQRNMLEVFDISARDQPPLQPKFAIPVSDPLSYANTPVYHGLHLYFAVSGAIMRVSVFGNEHPEPVPLKNFEASSIKPVPGCAPMGFEFSEANGGSYFVLVFVLEDRLLFYRPDLKTDSSYNHGMSEEDGLRSPVACGNCVVLTSKSGRLISLDISTKSVNKHNLSGFCLSAPVVLGKSVFMEAVHRSTGTRSLIQYEPESNQKTKTDLKRAGEVSNLDHWERSLRFPPLTSGKQIFATDTRSSTWITIHTRGMPNYRNLKQDEVTKFVPGDSLAINGNVYSASRFGVTVFSTRTGESRPIKLSSSDQEPALPAAPPIRYGDKLFLLCQQRLFCISI